MRATPAPKPGLPSDVAVRLAHLAPDQRAAATAPRGPVMCVAPAGSGKTTTLVARVAWLVATGSRPDQICCLTFNRRAAEELDTRLAVALNGDAARSIRARTFHALGREILRDAGERVEPLADRRRAIEEVLGRVVSAAEFRFLDDAFSRLKLDPQPASASVADLFGRYESHLVEAGALDFDDLVRNAVLLLERNGDVLEQWRGRATDLLVDEVQDLDRMQLRLALLLAAPANRVFLVGDDDQTIYAWRLADVRRVLGLAAALPRLRHVYLETNYRCPAPVVDRAVRLIAHNGERFAKTIRPRADAPGILLLAPDNGDDVARARRLFDTWPPSSVQSAAILSRTNLELAPFTAVAVERGIAFRCEDDRLLLDDPRIDELLEIAERERAPALVAIARASRRFAAAHDVRSALLCWAAPYETLTELRAVIERLRERRAALRRGDALLTLATVHGTKGLEFDHVACIGLDEGRFPSRRSITDAPDPGRALEEERRLAYVAWTRARRSLVLLYDPATPSPFLREAFDADELDPQLEGG